MKSSRIKKHERVAARHAVDSVLAAETEAWLPPGSVLQYPSHLSPEEIRRGLEKEQAAQACYPEILETVIRDVQHGWFRSLARFLPFYRSVLLRDVLNDKMSLLRFEELSETAQGGNKGAQDLLAATLSGLFTGPITGRPEVPEATRKEIVAACKKWRPICKGLNKAFEQLWKQSDYESSDLYRKEARGLLAEKYDISVKEVKTIEQVLKTPSRRSSKSTPTEAMLQMVALEHVNRGVKKIEEIWGDYLDEHPQERRKRGGFTT